MHPLKRIMLLINIVGGIAVLGSYAYGIAGNDNAGAILWGGVPESLRPLYTVSMLCAASGYFAFTGFLFLAVDPASARIAGRFDFRLFNYAYAGMLVGSALWLPLTFATVESGSGALWFATRVDLGVVALSSLTLLCGLAALDSRKPVLPYALGIVGVTAFSFQTVVLDALVWPAYF